MITTIKQVRLPKDVNSIRVMLEELAWSEIVWLETWKKTQGEMNKAFVSSQLEQIENTQTRLNKRLKFMLEPTMDGDVTDIMIEQAREYPVSSLFDDIVRGRVIPFCHSSNNYTAQVGEGGKNFMYCHKCKQAFNPIDILVVRDGYSFTDAVKRLVA